MRRMREQSVPADYHAVMISSVVKSFDPAAGDAADVMGMAVSAAAA